MNFDIDDLIKELGLDPEDGIEAIDYKAVSLIFRNGHRVICWYYQVDDNRAIIGLPFRINIDDHGVLQKILRYDLMSEEPFYLIPTDSVQMVSNISDGWFDRFEELCARWVGTPEGDEEPESEPKPAYH